MKPEVRLYRPGDEVAINEAFNRIFDRQRSVEEWAWKYRSAHLPCVIVAAWDGDRLAAHNGGIASQYQVDGQRILAMQATDTYSLAVAERKPEWRDAWQQVMDHFVEVSIEQFGVQMFYGFTGGQAVSHIVTRALGNSVEPRRIPLLTRTERPASRSSASRFFRARLIDDREPALDRLWERAGHRYPVSAVRDANHVWRRLSGHPLVRYHRWLITPRWSATPAAFVAFRTDDSIVRWIDLVWDGRPGALELADHLSRGLAEQSGAEREELWLDGDAEAAEWLECFGYESRPDPSGVVRAVRFIDAELKSEAFAPGRVYTTMADADLV